MSFIFCFHCVLFLVICGHVETANVTGPYPQLSPRVYPPLCRRRWASADTRPPARSVSTNWNGPLVAHSIVKSRLSPCWPPRPLSATSSRYKQLLPLLLPRQQQQCVSKRGNKAIQYLKNSSIQVWYTRYHLTQIWMDPKTSYQG